MLYSAQSEFVLLSNFFFLQNMMTVMVMVVMMRMAVVLLTLLEIQVEAGQLYGANKEKN